ncbi:diguanylate cyclase [Thalassotalea maritima]|uniref:sensor domain-containing diguanylate cyclase n=1 Tax=Thalassotalea maritima TaxID=3242416 RepID=UPI003527202E
MFLSQSFKQQLRPLRFVLLLSLAGFIINLFPLPLFSNIHLLLGNVAYVIVAMRFGVLYSLLAAFIVSTAFVISLDSPFGYLLFGLEAIFLACLRRRGWYVLYADIAYWLLLGMPLTLLLLEFVIDVPQQFVWFATVKQGFNGLIYACLAGLIVQFFPKTFALSYRQQPKIQRAFRQQLVYVTILAITLSVVTTSIFVSHNVIDSQHDMLEASIEEHNNSVHRSVVEMLEKHQLAVIHGAQTLAQMNANEGVAVTRYLQQLHRQYPQFVSMALTDNLGDISVSSPLGLRQQAAQRGQLNMAFRSYYQQAMSTEKAIMSEALQGQGFGSDAIVTFSHAYQFKDHLSHSGIVQGAIKLPTIANMVPKSTNANIAIVITDHLNNVAYASSHLNISPLTNFSYLEKRDLTFDDTGLFDILIDGETIAKEYFLRHSELPNRWHVYVLLDSATVLESVEKEYFLIFNLLFLAFLISASLAHKISIQVTRPIHFILKQVHQFEEDKEREFSPLYNNSAKEIITLYDEIKQAKTQLLSYQHELEDKVEARTQELALANDKLQKLAQLDGLTKLYNRRYFNNTFALFQKIAVRNNNDLALVLIDLDHFKKINDNYGHVAGDKCLQYVADLLKQEFSRETDLIARFGGEEFVLLINAISEVHLKRKLEKLRVDIEQACIMDGQQSLSVTASFGAILAPAKINDALEQWLKIADQALYHAKANGRNQVQLTHIRTNNGQFLQADSEEVLNANMCSTATID